MSKKKPKASVNEDIFRKYTDRQLLDQVEWAKKKLREFAKTAQGQAVLSVDPSLYKQIKEGVGAFQKQTMAEMAAFNKELKESAKDLEGKILDELTDDWSAWTAKSHSSPRPPRPPRPPLPPLPPSRSLQPKQKTYRPKRKALSPKMVGKVSTNKTTQQNPPSEYNMDYRGDTMIEHMKKIEDENKALKRKLAKADARTKLPVWFVVGVAVFAILVGLLFWLM